MKAYNVKVLNYFHSKFKVLNHFHRSSYVWNVLSVTQNFMPYRKPWATTRPLPMRLSPPLPHPRTLSVPLHAFGFIPPQAWSLPQVVRKKCFRKLKSCSRFINAKARFSLRSCFYINNRLFELLWIFKFSRYKLCRWTQYWKEKIYICKDNDDIKH